MTAIRKSYLIARETTFGSGQPKDGKWYVLPEGFYLSWSGSTQAQSLYGTGAKKRQNSIYGAFQGSWNASYVMDYNHLEVLSMIFDVVDNTPGSEAATSYDANTQLSTFQGENVYEHRFRKFNSKRQDSFVIKERVLNRIAGGLYDETNTLKGVLARNLQLARSTSGSQMAAEMSGVFSDKFTELHDTDQESFFVPINDPLTQYSCMYMGNNAEPVAMDAVEQVDSHSLQIETAVSLVYSTCTPIATDYFEDKTTFSWNATAYMNNPTKKFKLLSNSGGTMEPKIMDGGRDPITQLPLKSTDGTRALQPMGKNLAPLKYVNFITYAESYRDQYSAAYQSQISAYELSRNLIRVKATNSTVKSTSTPKGDGSKLQDSLSSVECDEIEIIIRNNNPLIWAVSNEYTAGAMETIDEVLFTQTAITDVSPAITFPMPVSGYDGQILGFKFIDQSETPLGEAILFNGTDGLPDLSGFVVVTDTAMFDVDDTQTPDTEGDQYRLDNLIPKQLTNGGTTAGLSGLIVGTTKQQIAGMDTVGTTDDDVYAIYPTISGTPQIKRTDYYFIVKEDTSTTPATYTTGYLCVVVR